MSSINHPIIKSGIYFIAFAYNIYAFYSGPQMFGVNDDAAMMQMANGLFQGGETSPYLVYAHYFVGKALNDLYGFFPDIEWYIVYSVSIYFIFSGILIFFLHQSSWSFISHIASLAALVFFFQYSARNIQFTVNAYVVAFAAISAFYYYNSRYDRFTRWMWIPVAFFTLSVMVRTEAAASVLAFTLPYFVLIFFNNRAMLYRAGVFSTLCFVIYIGLNGINHRYYRANPEWGQYMEYITDTGVILRANREWIKYMEYAADTGVILIDSKPILLKESSLREVDWIPLDVTIFKRFYFLDKEVFSLEKVRKLLALEKSKNKISYYVNHMDQFFGKQSSYLFFCILCIMPIILFHRMRILLLVMLAGQFIIFSWYDIFVQMPGRVLIPMLFLILVNHIYSMSSSLFIGTIKIINP